MTALGRIVPPDFEHVAKYPLSALPAAQRPTQAPVVIGINWYTNFDAPVRDSAGFYHVGAGSLGSSRSGHCVALEPAPGAEHDIPAAYAYYDQGQEGACVGFGCSRAQTLMKRQLFDGFWLYHQAQAIDGDPTPHEGTQVRCGLEILRTKGAVLGHGSVDVDRGEAGTPDLKWGIKAYRWLTSAHDVLVTLGMTSDYVNILNSWGGGYPHRVRMPASTLDRLLGEGGEAAVVTES